MKSEEKNLLEHSIWPNLYGIDADGPYLVGSRCRACGHVAFQLRRICPSCWTADEADPMPVGRTGVLYTYTTLHQVPAGFSAPMSVGYLDLEDGVRVFAHLELDAETLQIGRRLSLSIDELKRDEAGAPLFGPKYRAEPAA